MYDFKITDSDAIELKIDSNIYSDAVISKVLYWLSADFIVERKFISPCVNQIVLKHKTKSPVGRDLLKYESVISQMFSDFKVREMVRKETEGIRNILYLKAFANCPDIEDLRGRE